MTAPYGTWPSPLSARHVAEQGIRLAGVFLHDGELFWIEGRPSDGGRYVLVRRDRTGRTHDVGPAGFNARTRVQEYGGGAVTFGGRTAYASHFSDQRLYRIPLDAEPGGAPVAEPITPEGPWRFADAVFDATRRRLIAVREDHGRQDREAETTLVTIALDGPPDAGRVIASGYDFYASPRLSPDGRCLCWIAWRHPQMPWDGTELWVADLRDDGTLAPPRLVAGGPDESIYQPGWTLEGELLFASDRDGWWRLYRADAAGRGEVRPVLADAPARTEFGRPMWTFGTAAWASAGAGRLVVSATTDGRWRLATIDLSSGTLAGVATPLEPGDWLAADATHAVLVAGTATQAAAVVRLDLATGQHEVVRTSSTLVLEAGDVSAAESIWCDTDDGARVHAFYYPPANARCTAPAGERPPLIVIGHGGPTAATSALFDARIQFWTTRGIAVLDVNYGGSSGFGRAYRDRLRGTWGLTDVADIVAAARAVVAAGKADARRLAIRGGSAGGFTVLAALTTCPDVFAAGASYYGVSDLEALAADTHKFESRYLDSLVGPYPAARDLYRARSPIHHLDRLACPLILLQGLEDRVVPPNQSEAVADALRAKGLPVVYLAFPGEQHGFRKAETIVASLDAELAFYGSVMGFAPAPGPA